MAKQSVSRKSTHRLIDLTGRRFCKLAVVRIATDEERGRSARVKWLCRCDCGKYKILSGTNLSSGHTKSCGSIKCNPGMGNHKHGFSKHKLYGTWKAIIARCVDIKHKAYKSYGGRGITVCDKWASGPEEFIRWAEENSWAKGLTIDRIDNNLGYFPENCRVASRSEQSRNTSRNRFVEVDGRVLCAADAATLLNVPRETFRFRMNKGVYKEVRRCR